MNETPKPTPRKLNNKKPMEISTKDNHGLKKPIETIESPNLLYFNDQTSSQSHSDDSDDSFSIPGDEKYMQNGELSSIENRNSQNVHQVKIDRESFKDISLLFSDCEAILVIGGIDPQSVYGSVGNTGKDMYR